MNSKSLSLISAISIMLLMIDYYSYCVRTENRRSIADLQARVEALEKKIQENR